MDTQDETTEPAGTERSGSGLKTEISGKQLLVIAFIAIAGGLLYWQGPGLLERWQRSSITKHADPPTGWKGIELGITRREAAQLLADNNADWRNVPPPGMQVTEWASHINVTINGHSTKGTAFRFADLKRWDYGGHPVSSPEIVDVKTLIGSFDPESELTGIIWGVTKSEYDIANETVPVEVLKVIGEPHSMHRDITGASNIYMWKWPGIECMYTTIDGSFQIRTSAAK